MGAELLTVSVLINLEHSGRAFLHHTRGRVSYSQVGALATTDLGVVGTR